MLRAAAGENLESISETYALLFLSCSATHDMERLNVQPFLQQLNLKWHHIEISICTIKLMRDCPKGPDSLLLNLLYYMPFSFQ